MPQEHSNEVLEWDIDSWIGYDLTKLWIKSSGERSLSENTTESANLELSISRAVSAYWDIQFGLRHDFEPKLNGQSRDWASIGFIGTAPYFVDVDTRLFIGEESSSQLLVELEREFMLNQRWVLTPELDVVVNGSSNALRLEGSGLAEIEFELHLGSEPNRKIQPFAGFSIRQNFGNTRNLLKQNGSDTSTATVLIGLHGWF